MNKNLDILFKNFDVFQKSEKGMKRLKSLVFQLALSGHLDFQKLSNGRIKKPLKTLIKEQKAYLKKEGIPFNISSDANQNLEKFQERQATEKSHFIDEKLKKSLQALSKEQKQRLQKESIAFEEQPDSIWPIVQLGEVCKLYQPKTISQKEMIKTGKYLVFGANGVIGKYNKYNHKEIEILITCRGATCGTINLSEPKSWITGNAMVVKILSSKINKKYLFHLLGQSNFDSVITGAAQPQITRQKIMPFLIPLPPLEIQKEIVSLMEKCSLLEAQTKEKSQKQEEFSKSSMYFITHSKNKAELAHNYKRLKDNFKDILYSENGTKDFKSIIFQLMLSGRFDFKKLSNGRIKKSLKTLIKEQKAYLKKEGIPFNISSDANQNLEKFQEKQATEKSYFIDEKLKKSLQALSKEQKQRLQKESIAFEEQPDSIWPIVQLGEVCKFNPKKSEIKNFPKNYMVSFVPMSDLNSHNINFTIKKERQLKDVFQGYTYFVTGDILLARVTPCFENGKSGIAKNLRNGIGFGSSEYFIYRPDIKKILPEILYYFISSPTFIKEGKKNMGGTGGLQRLTKNYATRYKTPLPPLEVQKEIIAFMKVIENIEKQIQKEKALELELFQSLSHIEKYKKSYNDHT